MTRSKRTRVNFRVMGSFDMTRTQTATVTIERSPIHPMFHVRVLRRKRVYTLALADVARIITQRILMSEVAAKKAEKQKNRRAKRANRGLLSMR